MSKEFINTFITNKNSFYEISNLTNHQYLSEIFHIIYLNFNTHNNNDYNITFAIIYISCKIYYLNQQTKDKIYLCAILSKNKEYKNNTLWLKLIEYKVILKINEHLQHLLNVDMIDKSAFISNNSKKQSMLEKNGLSSYINNYSMLIDYKKELLDQFTLNELHLILIEFIPYICNYNFNNEDAIALIIEISKKFQMSKDLLNFYVSNIDAWCYSIKHLFPSKLNNITLVNKIYNIKYKRYQQIQTKYPIYSSIKEMQNEQKKIIITSVSKYIRLNEIINIFLLNKYIYKQTRRKYFKQYLQLNNISLSSRLNIWKCLLNYTTIKTQYNYANIVNEIQTQIPKTNDKLNDIVKIIENDVERTKFYVNEKQSKEAVVSILKTITYIKPHITYYQGMNYICSFIYQLFQNEQETFHIMIGLFEQTEFHLLFKDNLNNIKKYFFMFTRLLQMLLPECYSALQLNNINVDLFSTSWFLTMFSVNICFVNLNDPPLVILKIWEMFLIKGIRVLFASGITLLKLHEHTLVKIHNNEMIKFLVNYINKSDYFKNEYYFDFINVFNKAKISKKLILDLEKEYQFHQKEKHV